MHNPLVITSNTSITTPINGWVQTDTGLWVPAEPAIQIIGVPESPIIPPEGGDGTLSDVIRQTLHKM
jgi:hypothetical protein